MRKNVRAALVAPPLDAKPVVARSLGPVDPVLAGVVIALIGFGVVMVYSASAVQATVQHHDPQFFLARQAVFAGVALVALYLTSRFDYHALYKLTYPVLAVVGVLLVLC